MQHLIPNNLFAKQYQKPPQSPGYYLTIFYNDHGEVETNKTYHFPLNDKSKKTIELYIECVQEICEQMCHGFDKSNKDIALLVNNKKQLNYEDIFFLVDKISEGSAVCDGDFCIPESYSLKINDKNSSIHFDKVEVDYHY